MGGGMGGGHGGGGHRGGRQSPPSPGPAPANEAARPSRQTPLNKVEIVGVIKAIDTAGGRITIAYDEVDALNWPAGTNSFPVSKTSLLNGARVGEKVRFRIESQQIEDLAPYTPGQGGDATQRTG